MVIRIGIMGVIIGLIIGVIGLVIVTEIIEDANFTAYGNLLETVTDNIGNRGSGYDSVETDTVRGWTSRPCRLLGRHEVNAGGVW